MGIRKIVSGGQTGVDRGALDLAIELGLEHGGFCPQARRAEDGVIPARYELVSTESTGYPQRTRLNVQHSDATLILTSERRPRGGTRMTAKFAHERGTPWLAADPTREEHVDKVASWLVKINPSVLNVAGPRESKIPGISGRTRAFLRMVFERLS
jgi:predicted Rossmann fold nucleotide-binding protein DprA/Smf involved in DNA uptake